MEKPEYLEPAGGRADAGRTRALANADSTNGSALNEAQNAWVSLIRSASVRGLDLEEWFAECVMWGHQVLKNSVEIDPKRRGGIPVLKGTRFTVGQTLAELAESSGVPEIATRFDLDEGTIREMLFGLSLLVERPCK